MFFCKLWSLPAGPPFGPTKTVILAAMMSEQKKDEISSEEETSDGEVVLF